METSRHIIELLLSATAGAVSSTLAGVVLVIFRVAVSSRRRKQLSDLHQQLTKHRLGYSTLIRKLLTETPEPPFRPESVPTGTSAHL